MANPITVLTTKRQRLHERKNQLKRDYERQLKEIDDEIGNIDNVLKTISEAASQYCCKACGGTGYQTKLDAAGSREEVTCTRCHGTGYDVSK